MVLLRNRVTAARSGGPRQFAELRDKIIVRAGDDSELRDVTSDLDRIGIETRELNNAPILVGEPRSTAADVFDRLASIDEDNGFIRQAADEVANADGPVMEVGRSINRASRQLFNFVSGLSGVRFQEFVQTFVDYGPENLRFSPTDMPLVEEGEFFESDRTLEDINSMFNMEEVWSETRGENAIIAVFDTAFADDLFDSSRIRNTWSGESVDSVFEPQEAHGSMCAGAATANSEEGVPYSGMAPEADVILVRITDDSGQIRGDYVTEAWDWLTDLDTQRPVISNHSYGTPLCSGRPRSRFCNTAENEMVSIATSTANQTAVYAAGNEATTCGRRLSGVTNAVTGTNSLADVITVGAARFDRRDAQEYSSHGRGDCAPQADPKPNVTFPLPDLTYYGDEDGYTVHDMSKGVGGSAGGTSHAAPSVAGIVALAQSKHFEENGEAMQTEELKALLHEHAEQPRRTQVNVVSGALGQRSFDARFGHGIPDPASILEAV